MTTKRLLPLCTVSDNPSEVFTLRFSPDGKFLAAGCGDGAVRVYNSNSGRLAYELSNNSSSSELLPTTAIRWRPPGASKTKNVLLAANADGSVSHWHITSGKCLHTVRDPDNQIYCIDYSADGTQFATAGKDYVVRLYDEATRTVLHEMKGGWGKESPGHSNRVFSLKFNPSDPNILVSGGWDNTVQVWDIRTETSVRHIFGPHICGDAVDVQGTQVLTGSWRPSEQLQLWDIGTGELIETIPWHQSAVHASEPAMLYCAQFSKNNSNLIAAGGSGSNEAKVFDMGSGRAEPVGTVSGLERGVFTLDFSPDDGKVAVAGGDTAIRVLTIEEKAGIMTPREGEDGGYEGKGDEQQQQEEDEGKNGSSSSEAPASDNNYVGEDGAVVMAAEEKDGVVASEGKVD